MHILKRMIVGVGLFGSALGVAFALNVIRASGQVGVSESSGCGMSGLAALVGSLVGFSSLIVSLAWSLLALVTAVKLRDDQSYVPTTLGVWNFATASVIAILVVPLAEAVTVVVAMLFAAFTLAVLLPLTRAWPTRSSEYGAP